MEIGVDNCGKVAAVGSHAIQIDFGLIFLGFATQNGNVRHSRHDP